MKYPGHRRRFKLVTFFSILTSCLLISSHVHLNNHKPKLNIHYTLNYAGDTWEKNRTGLLWSLSYLGAELPKNSFDSSITWLNERTFNLNFGMLGFSDRALQALQLICDSLKETRVYKKTNSVDLGHFVTIVLGSSWHYYQITEAPKTYKDFTRLHNFTNYEVMPITRSSVSHHHRLLKMLLKDSILHSAFVAEEGEGELTSGTFNALEYETMDVMKNGQLRFMIYNQDGVLTAAGNKSFGAAGKPVKCVWCHEISIQPLFGTTDTIKGFMNQDEFAGKIKVQSDLLKAYRLSLKGDIDFSKLQDHTYQELIYISFMEPSMQRLSQEWNMPAKKIQALLKNKPSHIHHEFGFLGELYDRKDLVNSTRYHPGTLPMSIREENEAEPNFFKAINR